MKLTHFFIDHPRFAAVINIFFTLFGLAAMVALPIAQYPNIVPPDHPNHHGVSWRLG